MEKLDADYLPQAPLDEFSLLIGMLGDVIDGLELGQALCPDPFIESQLADLRYVRDRQAKLLLIEQTRAAR